MVHTRRRRAAVALAALVTLTLTACGGGGDSGAASAKAAIKADILRSEKSGGDATSPLKLNDTQAGCFAGQLVDHLGVAALKKDGVLTADDKVTHALSSAGLTLPAADANTLVSALFDCTNGGGPVIAVSRDALTSQMGRMPATAKTCVDDKIDAALVRKILVASMSGQDQAPLITEINQLHQACMQSGSGH